jgi:pyruvate dehydrogenase E1 component beta subunit
MPIDILMPALSPTMEEGKLAKWLKKEGDEVRPGDIIAEIETDKATMEVEAVDEGTLASILVAEGTDNVKVNTPIAVIGVEGEDEVGEVAGEPARIAARENGGGEPQAAEAAPPSQPERKTATAPAAPTPGPS